MHFACEGAGPRRKAALGRRHVVVRRRLRRPPPGRWCVSQRQCAPWTERAMMYSMVSEYPSYEGPQQPTAGDGQFQPPPHHHHHQTNHPQSAYQEASHDYYYGLPEAVRDDCNIITSDNGLCYTNLDYANAGGGSGGGSHHHHHQYYAPAASTASAEYYPEYAYHPQQHHHQPPPPPQPPEYHGLHQHNNHHQQQNSQQAAVPTYKWMQVKRNVPKPSGRFKLFD